MFIQNYEYNERYFHDDALHQLSPKKTAFRTQILSNGIIVALFQGSRGAHKDLDFVVKVLRPGKDERPEPPIHTYWVVDLMIKSHKYPKEIKEILDFFIDFYEKCEPFETVEERDSYSPKTVKLIYDKYKYIDIFKTLPMDYIAFVIEYFSLCEKRNEGAYMFKNILLALKKYIDGELDYMHVIKASMPGFR